jgi:CrcB protein
MKVVLSETPMSFPLFCVFLGGGIGAALRWLVSWSLSGPGHFPWATLLVNVTGSLAIGVVAGLGQPHAWYQEWGRYLIVTGLLGGFTTFSAFSLETVALADSGRNGLAVLYASVSVLLCLGAAWVGLRLSEQ